MFKYKLTPLNDEEQAPLNNDNQDSRIKYKLTPLDEDQAPKNSPYLSYRGLTLIPVGDDTDAPPQSRTKRGEVGLARGLARAAAQGLSFGWGDEVEAYFRSLAGDETYDEEVASIRNEIDQFRDERPVTAYGTEIAASLLPTILSFGGAGALTGGRLAALGAKVAANPLKAGALSGAVYGAGAADGDIQSRLVSGGIGAATGGALSKLAPKATESAKRLIKKGVPLTLGQAIGGGIGRLEEGMSSIPLAGVTVANARNRARTAFNNVVAEEVLKPIGAKTPQLEGRDLVKVVDDIITKEYDKLLPNLDVPSGSALRSKIDDILMSVQTTYGDLEPRVISSIKTDFQHYIYNLMDANGNLSGEGFKKAQSGLRSLAKKLANMSDPTVSDVRRNAVYAAEDMLMDELAKKNPSQAVKLRAIDDAYIRMIPLARASISAEGGSFTPKQLGTALKLADPTKHKRSFARGDAPMQRLADEGAEVLTSRIGDSGTPDRVLGATLAGGGVGVGLGTGQLFNMLLGSGVLSALYAPGVSARVREGSLRVLAPLMRLGAPYASGQIGNLITDN